MTFNELYEQVKRMNRGRRVAWTLKPAEILVLMDKMREIEEAIGLSEKAELQAIPKPRGSGEESSGKESK